MNLSDQLLRVCFPIFVIIMDVQTSPFRLVHLFDTTLLTIHYCNRTLNYMNGPHRFPMYGMSSELKTVNPRFIQVVQYKPKLTPRN